MDAEKPAIACHGTFEILFAQLKTINSTESARESNSRSTDTKPHKRGCFQPDD
jgi:hypothetical protein